MDNGWLKLRRGQKTRELLRDPVAFTLAAIIAYRSKRNSSFNIHSLSPGEALIGDYKNYGMTQKQYREAKKRLEKWGIAAFQGTSKGTIATLCDNNLYDINFEQDGERGANEGRTKGRAKGEQRGEQNNATSLCSDRLYDINLEQHGERNGNQGASKERTKGRLMKNNYFLRASPPYNPPPKQSQNFESFWQVYPRKVGKGAAQKAWAKLKFTNGFFEQILTAVELQKKSRQWNRDYGRYVPNPETWLDQKRWLDELETEDGHNRNNADNSKDEQRIFIR